MATALTFEVLSPEYGELLASLEVRPEWQARIDRAARYIVTNRLRYQQLEEELGVPWAFIGALHWRESTGSFSKHLHNGDPLTARTRRVPAGRPPATVGNPPFDWETSAQDSLMLKRLQNVTDWGPERVCFETERWNGFGYRLRNTGHLSPFLWSGTLHYTVGKFYEDRKYSATMVDQQVGAIPVYLRVLELTETQETTAAETVTMAASSKMTVARRAKRLVETAWGGLAAWCTYDNAVWVLQIGLAVGAAGLVIWLLMHYFQNRTRLDIREGRYVPSKVRLATPPGA